MKIKLEQILNQTDINIIIQYEQMNEIVQQLITLVQSFDNTVPGFDGPEQIRIRISDIYYIESVDKRTFIYGQNNVFSTEYRLYELLEQLEQYEFCQINKSCIVNLNKLKSLKPYLLKCFYVLYVFSILFQSKCKNNRSI